MFTSSFFIANRQKLRKAASAGWPICITANGLVQEKADVSFPFSQDSNFLYLTGLADMADAVLVLDENEEFLILREKTEVEITFEGDYNCDEIAKISGIRTVLCGKEGWERLKKLQQSRKKIYSLMVPKRFLHNAYTNFYLNPAKLHLLQQLRRFGWKAADIVDIRTELVQLRQIKQPEELAAIKQAINLTQQGFVQAKALLKAGVYEYELEAAFDSIFKQNNTRHAYPPIVAAGKNACILHYGTNNAQLQQGELVLFDVGAQWQGYAADITRTYSMKQSARHDEVVEAVYNVQKQAMQLLVPGLDWRVYRDRVEQLMGEQLMKLKLIAKPTAEAIHKYFPHGVSHGLGLDVHDVCDYKLIQENMVITVEPGIYIPEEGIGVRIEDDVLITKNGAQNLSADIPYA